eukprot:CAMPEP_0172562304 /NCGR_PEP_ID=MMETSP1067-20121228/96405_1 /TAXON_ID=265564 ORGANISM="Thalassiosira punctigera, Strain Tpunct2005C2" /NCGR_SAMPLE_ID=MMETSP1067 /ASSEMBLY_ACC=CAM_ASM_000444 /LENGTH=65 /DNA_ID=CAMNT_0013352505 /DNA_START=1 /DNA_END=195 /DNA_ORIENTATION=+
MGQDRRGGGALREHRGLSEGVPELVRSVGDAESQARLRPLDAGQDLHPRERHQERGDGPLGGLRV